MLPHGNTRTVLEAIDDNSQETHPSHMFPAIFRGSFAFEIFCVLQRVNAPDHPFLFPGVR